MYTWPNQIKMLLSKSTKPTITPKIAPTKATSIDMKTVCFITKPVTKATASNPNTTKWLLLSKFLPLA